VGASVGGVDASASKARNVRGTIPFVDYSEHLDLVVPRKTHPKSTNIPQD
jgi:hypothetical protein